MAVRGAGQGHGRACRDPRLAAWEPEPSCDLRCHVEDSSDLRVPSTDRPGVSSPVPGAHPAQWGVGCARRFSEIHAQFREATGAGAGRGSLIYGLCVARLTGGGAWPVSGPRGMDCGSLVSGRSGAPGPHPRTRSTRDTPQPRFTARASCRRIGVGEAPKTAPLSDPQPCGPAGPRATALHRARVCFAPVGRRRVRGHGL